MSPDNIFMLEPREKGAFPTELLLLDFNSVYSMDDRTTYLGDYYPGKPGYMAPEAALSRTEEMGPWTDLYSAAAVWYTLLCDGKVPEDMEITSEEELVSPYSRLLLHEKEVAAEQVNRILRRGLRMMPSDRYSSTAEIRRDIHPYRCGEDPCLPAPGHRNVGEDRERRGCGKQKYRGRRKKMECAFLESRGMDCGSTAADMCSFSGRKDEPQNRKR